MTKETPSTILIVEDEPSMQQALQDRLKEDGYQVLATSTATEAISLLEQHTVDLILLDLRLEEGSGMDVLNTVMADDQHKTAVLVLSNIEHPSMKADIMGWGLKADDYLVKTEHSLDDISARVAKKLTKESSR